MARMLTCVLVLALVWTSVALAAEKAKVPELDLKTDGQKLSYSMGLEIGGSLKRMDMEMDLTALIRGITDRLKGREPLLNAREVAQIQKAFMERQRVAQMTKRKVASERNAKEGAAFLAANGKKAGVVSTESGLQYTVLKEGDGPRPKATDRVKVHYKGTLLDGTVFDSSYKRGKPAVFAANRVIPGWTEALQLMKVGSKYKLFIPANIGYGDRGAGAMIGPNATLIFEVELLGIEK